MVHKMQNAFALALLAPASGLTLGAWRPSPARATLRMESEMQWRRRMQEQGSKPEGRPDNDDVRQQRNSVVGSTEVDNIDFFGGTGGGTLTRKGISDANKVTSNSLEAVEELSAAVDAAGTMSPEETTSELQRLIGAAFAAGVSERSPQMQQAAALLRALEQAAEQSQQVSGVAVTDDDDEAVKERDRNAKLDALFANEYSVFGDDEDASS